MAVAWVRRSGTSHLLPSLAHFLTNGGVTRFTVGVDIENTSKEGLEDLLSLAASGLAETFIYHNEYRVTFHPKLYLFSSGESARLIVGSNNLTEAGLFSNTEAGVQIDAGINDPLIVEARTALAVWRDPQDGLAKKLDQTFLADLVSAGYVLSESALQQRRRDAEKAAKTAKSQSESKKPLFKRKVVTVPLRPQTVPVPAGANAVGRVLLMRVRRASETARRTQIQFPIRLVRTQFFNQINTVVSSHDGRAHGLHAATARGSTNTIKVEIPEIDPMPDPVLRLERTATGILYEAYDANSVRGRPIMDALRRGFNQVPSTTTLTKPNDPDRSTWYRFI